MAQPLHWFIIVLQFGTYSTCGMIYFCKLRVLPPFGVLYQQHNQYQQQRRKLLACSFFHPFLLTSLLNNVFVDDRVWFRKGKGYQFIFVRKSLLRWGSSRGPVLLISDREGIRFMIHEPSLSDQVCTIILAKPKLFCICLARIGVITVSDDVNCTHVFPWLINP